jgi:hypothetical protein
MSAFGLDDRAKASATTSGGDPRSQLRPPYLRLWLRHGSTMQRPRGRALLRGMSLAQTPPGLPPARRLPGGFACWGQQAGIYLARQGRSAERRCPHERGVPGPRLGHMPSEPSAHCPFQELFLTPHSFAPDGRDGGGPLITRTEEVRGFKSPHLHPTPMTSGNVGHLGPVVSRVSRDRGCRAPHFPVRATAHCSPRTNFGSSVERTAKLHPLWRCLRTSRELFVMEWDGCGPGRTWWGSWTADPQAAVLGGSHVSCQRISKLEAKPVDRTGAVGAWPACAVGGSSDPKQPRRVPAAGCRATVELTLTSALSKRPTNSGTSSGHPLFYGQVSYCPGPVVPGPWSSAEVYAFPVLLRLRHSQPDSAAAASKPRIPIRRVSVWVMKTMPITIGPTLAPLSMIASCATLWWRFRSSTGRAALGGPVASTRDSRALGDQRIVPARSSRPTNCSTAARMPTAG